MSARSNRSVAKRLEDILQAVGRTGCAEEQLVRAEESGDVDATRVAFDAVLYNLVVIGEAVNALPLELTDKEPGVPWRDVVGMRNFLSHEYFRVAASVVRLTIDEPLGQLREVCRRLLAGENPSR